MMKPDFELLVSLMTKHDCEHRLWAVLACDAIFPFVLIRSDHRSPERTFQWMTFPHVKFASASFRFHMSFDRCCFTSSGGTNCHSGRLAALSRKQRGAFEAIWIGGDFVGLAPQSSHWENCRDILQINGKIPMKRSFFRFMNVMCPGWMENGGNVLPKRGLKLFLNGKNPGGSDIGSSAKGLAFLWFQDPTLPTSSLKKRRDVGNVFVISCYIISRTHTLYIQM